MKTATTSKDIPLKKDEEKAKKRDYAYTELAKLKVGSAPVNVYGIVIDATFPHKSFKSEKYICSFKIADPTSKMSDGIVDYVSVVFFAKRFDDLPICQTVGEILRLHRCTVSEFKGKIQLAVNICFNSSWALFQPQKPGKKQELIPLSFFGKSMHTELADKNITKTLSSWASTVFQKNNVLSSKFITPLSAVPAVGATRPDGKAGFDFDLQVKILQLFRVDEYQSEMRVIDNSGQIWHSSVFNLKYQTIKEGAYVRIRAASLANHSTYTRTFGMRPYSNILALPYPCKLAEDMLFDEISNAHAFELNEIAHKDKILMHAIIITQIKDASITPLISNLNDIKADGVVHRVRVTVSHSSSIDPSKCVKMREKGEIKCAPAQLKKGQELVTCVQFLVKDASQLSGNLFTRLNVIDTGSFFNISPKEIQTNKKNLKDSIQMLERFNIWIEASVERRNGQLYVTEATSMKKYE